MRSILLASTALIALTMPAFAQEEPRPVDEAVASSNDSGTVERSNPEMAEVITKLMELGAKPVHTLSVEEAGASRRPPMPSRQWSRKRPVLPLHRKRLPRLRT